MPATIRTTRSAAAATRWLTVPRRSRKRRPAGRLRVHAFADLVGDDREREGPAPDQPGEGIGLGEDGVGGVAAEHPVGHPHREAIDDHGIAGDPCELRNEIEGLFDRGPVDRALPAPVPRDARGHVAIAGLRGGQEGDPRVRRLAGNREAALAAARAPEDEERRDHYRQTLPRRPA